MSRPDRLVSALLMFGTGTLLLLGLAMTGTGIEKVRAEAFMERWAQKGSEPDALAWSAARDAAATAVARYPVFNGEYEDRLGRVYLWRHFRQPPGAAIARDSLEQAREAFDRSLSARPVAPATQARLAHTYLLLQQPGAALSRHISMARAQGPWQVEVNREVAEVGLMAWPSLAPVPRQQAMDAYCAALLVPPPAQDPLLALARRVGQLPTSCRQGRYMPPS
jgi:hypothetical protein